MACNSNKSIFLYNPPMNEKRSVLIIEIPPSTRRALKMTAASRGCSIRALVEPALNRIIAGADIHPAKPTPIPDTRNPVQ